MESPVIIGCPGSQTSPNDQGLATASVTWEEPTASDNSGSVMLSATYDSGDAFPIGSTEVVYTATDSSGNTVECSFSIVVSGRLQLCYTFGRKNEKEHCGLLVAIFWPFKLCIEQLTSKIVYII